MNMEEGHNQHVIAPNRIKCQELMDKGKEDRMSELPDCLLIEILSRLPSTKHAIITGSLSKRWKHVWTGVNTLIFKYYDRRLHWSDFASFVDKTLTQCRQLKLKKFELNTGSLDIQGGSQLNDWICYAISHNVEELNLTLRSIRDEFPLDQPFFINTCFTHLRLSGCKLNPSGAITWKSLRSLCIFDKKLDEVLIENILSGSPLLKTLVLEYCHGYMRLDINSKSVKKLVLDGYLISDVASDTDIIEINAPHILSLTVISLVLLWKPLLVNATSLVEANLDYKNLWIKEEEEVLKGFILNLRHVKVLKIGVRCSQILSRLEAKGFVIPSNIKFTDALLSKANVW